MSFFNQFPDNIVSIQSIGAPYIIGLGTVTGDPDDGSRQLQIMRIQLFIAGFQPGVTMRIHAYRGATLLGSSEIVSVSVLQAEYNATAYFYGWVNFTFTPRINVSTSTATRFELELFNYSFVEATTWIGVVLDWPVQMGYNSSPGAITAAPVAMELFVADPVA